MEDILNSCFAEYDGENGRLRVGNALIEKTVRVKGGLFRTESVRDIRGGREWSVEEPLWQSCPVFDPGETTRTFFEKSPRTVEPGMKPHLKAELRTEGRRGTVWREFLVFEGVPFVCSRAFVRLDGEGALTAPGAPRADGPGPDGSREIFCGSDVLDAVGLGKCRLELETFRLYDKTDETDTLLERQTSEVYVRGRTERTGSVFRLTDAATGSSLLLVKHSPVPGSALNRRGSDLVIRDGRYAVLTGTGVDFSSLPRGRVPYYASAVGTGDAPRMQDLFWEYSTALSAGDPGRRLFFMTNTWGDRSLDSAICEEFIMKELERAREVGADILQIDDGWQKGHTAGSTRGGGVWEGYYDLDSGFWEPDPARFPRGLGPVAARAKEYGIELGLWFGPDSSDDFANWERDTETLWDIYRRWGVRRFKLDGVKIRSKKGEMRFISLLRGLTERSGGDIRFNLDITAEDRFGYLYQTRYGTLFLENRYTDWGNYYPHCTFRNLWSLASVIPARRLQAEFLNCRRNAGKYEGMPFAPRLYRIDYLFGTVMAANPLGWMELSGLSEEDARTLAGIVKIFKTYAGELFESQVIPIGECPNGKRFSGYFCRCRPKGYGHALLFREQTEEPGHLFELPDPVSEEGISLIYASAPCGFEAAGRGILARFSEVRSFIWLRCRLGEAESSREPAAGSEP